MAEGGYLPFHEHGHPASRDSSVALDFADSDDETMPKVCEMEDALCCCAVFLSEGQKIVYSRYRSNKLTLWEELLRISEKDMVREFMNAYDPETLGERAGRTASLVHGWGRLLGLYPCQSLPSMKEMVTPDMFSVYHTSFCTRFYRFFILTLFVSCLALQWIQCHPNSIFDDVTNTNRSRYVDTGVWTEYAVHEYTCTCSYLWDRLAPRVLYLICAGLVINIWSEKFHGGYTRVLAAAYDAVTEHEVPKALARYNAYCTYDYWRVSMVMIIMGAVSAATTLIIDNGLIKIVTDDDAHRVALSGWLPVACVSTLVNMLTDCGTFFCLLTHSISIKFLALMMFSMEGIFYLRLMRDDVYGLNLIRDQCTLLRQMVQEAQLFSGMGLLLMMVTVCRFAARVYSDLNALPVRYDSLGYLAIAALYIIVTIKNVIESRRLSSRGKWHVDFCYLPVRDRNTPPSEPPYPPDHESPLFPVAPVISIRKQREMEDMATPDVIERRDNPSPPRGPQIVYPYARPEGYIYPLQEPRQMYDGLTTPDLVRRPSGRGPPINIYFECPPVKGKLFGRTIGRCTLLMYAICILVGGSIYYVLITYCSLGF